MELLKPSRFNIDKCINVLLGIRNAATRRAVFWGLMTLLRSSETQHKFPERCCSKSMCRGLQQGIGVQQSADTHLGCLLLL